jgi:hypothetical protein
VPAAGLAGEGPERSPSPPRSGGAPEFWEGDPPASGAPTARGGRPPRLSNVRRERLGGEEGRGDEHPHVPERVLGGLVGENHW